MDLFNNYIKLSDNFTYSNYCYESFPCTHDVKIIENKNNIEKKECWDIQRIYKYCVDNNLKVPKHVARENNIIETGNYGNNWDGHS